MKILYINRKGNLLRLYLGKKTRDWGWTNPFYRDINNQICLPSEDYFGDDWDDAPYEHNCGTIYPEFVYKEVDVAIPYDWEIVEASTNTMNSMYCIDDFKEHLRPFMVILPKKLANEYMYCERYEDVIEKSDDEVIKIYLEDNYSDVMKKIKVLKEKELDKDE